MSLTLCVVEPLAPPLRLTFTLCCLVAACNPSLCRAKGRGLQPKGLRVKETADFKVYTKGAGTGELKVSIKGPSELQRTCGAPPIPFCVICIDIEFLFEVWLLKLHVMGLKRITAGIQGQLKQFEKQLLNANANAN